VELPENDGIQGDNPRFDVCPPENPLTARSRRSPNTTFV
jgi:hypothetical protein